MRRVVIAHGGTASKPDMKDGTDAAVAAGMKALKRDGPMAAVVAACVVLEDDERYNAGTGSNYRFDGRTIEMDAALMDSRKKYGAVSSVQRVRNPVRVAKCLLAMPNNILTGEGATRFARRMGFEEHDPATPQAREKWRELVKNIRNGDDSPSDNEWDYETLRRAWNYERPFEEVFGGERWKPRKGETTRTGFATDTVGAVATDGRTFASATSTGGTIVTLKGRVGDTPNIGAGIFAGECGCAALTGNGDHILRDRAATMVHGWLAEGFSAQAVVRRLTSSYQDDTDMWACVIGLEDHAGGGNREIAWTAVAER